MDIEIFKATDDALFRRLASVTEDVYDPETRAFHEEIKKFIQRLSDVYEELEYHEDYAWVNSTITAWETHLRSMGIAIPYTPLPSPSRSLRMKVSSENVLDSSAGGQGSGDHKTRGVLDHTVVPTHDKNETGQFFTEYLGFENLGARGEFIAVRVNEDCILNFKESADFRPIHYAFSLDQKDFESAFDKIRATNLPYGDRPSEPDNMKGPGITPGAKGNAKSIYFRDPNDHLVEIRHY